MIDILLDIQLAGDDRPLETRCRLFACDGRVVVYYQDTDADISHLLTQDQRETCLKHYNESTQEG